MLHPLFENESLRKLFFQSTASLTRAELDAGKSHINRPPSFHEGVVKLYNNPSFTPLSENITHPFFMSEQFDILFEDAQGKMVDAIKAKTGLQHSARILPLSAVNG